MQTKLAIAALGFVLVVLGGTGAALLLTPRSDDVYASCRSTKIAGGAQALGGPFTLTNQDNQRVSHADVFDKPSLVYFGYTYCPDVCPLDAARNVEAHDLLREQNIALNNVFITIDPARDTPAALKEYLSYFDESIAGLTGSQDDVIAAAKAYRVYFAKNGEGEDYLMDHSAFTYLTDTNGQVVEIFRRDLEADALANQLSCFTEKMSS